MEVERIVPEISEMNIIYLYCFNKALVNEQLDLLLFRNQD